MARRRDEEETGEPVWEGPSKSSRKRDALEAQRLGVRLAELPEPDLEALGLPERLLDALHEARRITSRAAGARHRQFIGKLMRDLDSQQIVAALEERDRRRSLETQRQKRIEAWRQRLLREGERALGELASAHPNAQVETLARLVAAASPQNLAESDRIAASRELFRALRELLGAPDAPVGKAS
jgi:ribosome-associated protein